VRIILDENVPREVGLMLAPSDVTTVQEAGFRGLQNGELLSVIEGGFDVFVTADKNLRSQQNFTGRTLSIVELPMNRLPILRSLYSKIADAIDNSSSSSYHTVSL
jgi:hypothetical protein